MKARSLVALLAVAAALSATASGCFFFSCEDRSLRRAWSVVTTRGKAARAS